MSGNHHVRFLGEEAAATPSPYPTNQRTCGGDDGEPEHFAGMDYPGVTINGIPGATYQIQYSSNLSSNWIALTNFTLPYSPYLWFDASSFPHVQRCQCAAIHAGILSHPVVGLAAGGSAGSRDHRWLAARENGERDQATDCRHAPNDPERQ
jgi:hypothetical protein